MGLRSALFPFAVLGFLILLVWRVTVWVGLDSEVNVDLSFYDYDRYSQGRLFLMQKEDHGDIYLFGTFHSSDPRVFELPKSVKDAFAASDVYAAEALPWSDDRPDRALATAILATQLFELCQLPDEVSLQQLVGDELFDAVVQRANDPAFRAAYGSKSEAELQRLTPWCLASSLQQSGPDIERQAGGWPILDYWLLDQARAKRKVIKHLESFDEQLHFAKMMPIDLQIEELTAVMQDYEQEVMNESWEESIDTYLRGELAEWYPPVGVSERYANYHMLHAIIARNWRMARRILGDADDRTVFVAVGAGHLPGEEGLVNLLAREGYTATVLEPPP